MSDTKKTAYISHYSGYRHNRFDGYYCSWGVLMALGASRTADCFADADDYPDDDFDTNFNGDGEIGNGCNDEFRKNVLCELDVDKSFIDDIKNLTPEDDPIKHNEYWGNNAITIIFKNVDGKIMCNYNNEENYICEF